MEHMHRRHWPIDGLANLRDIGGYRASDGQTTRWRRVWRADAPHGLNAEGRAVLRHAGLAKVIDLRTADEIAAAPSPFAAAEGIDYRNISLFANLAPIRMLIETPGGKPFRLADRYRNALDRCQEALTEVFAAIDEAGDRAVLINCTAGKDRTGIVIALLLLALGVDEETVVADYALTEQVAAPLFTRLRAAALARGSDLTALGEIFSSPEGAMRQTLDCLERDHGGADAFLVRIGVDATMRRRLAASLLEKTPVEAAATLSA